MEALVIKNLEICSSFTKYWDIWSSLIEGSVNCRAIERRTVNPQVSTVCRTKVLALAYVVIWPYCSPHIYITMPQARSRVQPLVARTDCLILSEVCERSVRITSQVLEDRICSLKCQNTLLDVILSRECICVFTIICEVCECRGVIVVLYLFLVVESELFHLINVKALVKVHVCRSFFLA